MHSILYSYITTLFIPSYLPLLSFCCVLTHSTSWTVRNIQSLHLYVFSTGCAVTRVVFYPLLLLTAGQRFMRILFLKQISKPVYCLCCFLIYSIRCGMLFANGFSYKILQIFKECGRSNQLFLYAKRSISTRKNKHIKVFSEK